MRVKEWKSEKCGKGERIKIGRGTSERQRMGEKEEGVTIKGVECN